MNSTSRKGAVIEIGTNSIKLFVAKAVEKQKVETICYDRKITRLGKGLEKNGHLLPESMERSLQAIKEYQQRAQAEGVEKILSIGTHVLRTAKNASDFITLVKESTGILIEVLSSEYEAIFSREGVLLDYKKIPGLEMVILDIGGGSTEIIKDIWVKSIPIGAVSISETMLSGDPPAEIEIVKALSRIQDRFLQDITFLVPGDLIFTVGVGGTITAAAALVLKLDQYDPEKIQNCELRENDVVEIFENLRLLDVDARRALMPFDPDRADVIVGGLLILKSFFRFFNVKRFNVSIKNIIHGYFYRKFVKSL